MWRIIYEEIYIFVAAKSVYERFWRTQNMLGFHIFYFIQKNKKMQRNYTQKNNIELKHSSFYLSQLFFYVFQPHLTTYFSNSFFTTFSLLPFPFFVFNCKLKIISQTKQKIEIKKSQIGMLFESD